MLRPTYRRRWIREGEFQPRVHIADRQRSRCLSYSLDEKVERRCLVRRGNGQSPYCVVRVSLIWVSHRSWLGSTNNRPRISVGKQVELSTADRTRRHYEIRLVS